MSRLDHFGGKAHIGLLLLGTVNQYLVGRRRRPWEPTRNQLESPLTVQRLARSSVVRVSVLERAREI